MEVRGSLTYRTDHTCFSLAMDGVSKESLERRGKGVVVLPLEG